MNHDDMRVLNERAKSLLSERPVTVNTVKGLVAIIDAVKDDDEWAHILEDDLYNRVLTAIAGGWCENPERCATESVLTANIGFRKYFS